ncbi:MAG: ABC transporter substrate-binding protein [Candidatus Limimorpha sp.]
MEKKKYLLFTLLGVLILLVSCQKNKKLTVIGENAANLQAMIALKDSAERRINFEVDFKPNTFEDAFNKSNQDFMNKTGLYDIVMQYCFALSSYVRNDYIDVLSDYHPSFESEIYPNVWKEIGYYYKDLKQNIGEQKVAYPFTALTQVLVYNKELFNDPIQKSNYQKKYGKELDIPKTWTDFYNVAQFFTQKENSLYGVCIEGADNPWAYNEWVNFVFGQGGKIMDKNRGWEGDLSTKVLVNSPEVIEATKYYLSLKPFNAGNYFTVDHTKQVEILLQGKTAMAIVWSDGLYGLSHQNGKFSETFGYATIPGEVSSLGGGSFFINKRTKHLPKVKEYIEYFYDKNTQVQLILNGLCSPSISVYEDERVQHIPYIKAVQESIDRSVYMFEGGPDADVISNILNNTLQRIWRGEVSVENGLNSAQEEIIKMRKEVFSEINK